MPAMRTLAITLLTSVLAVGAVPAGAADYATGAVWKLSRGVVNTATGLPGEIVAHTVLESTDRGLAGVPAYVSSVVTGVVVGTGWGLLRIGSGIADVVTFAAPIDENRPLLEPEFAF
jgi:putative exosortase-associated protein (TIGR04073 family)